MSLVGAILLAVLFGVALPWLFFLIVKHVRWARLSRVAGVGILVWLLGVGLAWSFDAYCRWFGLTNELSVMLFLWALVLAIGTGYGFRRYRSLNRVVSEAYLEQERKLLRVMQRVSLGGFFVSEKLPDKSEWVIMTANRAACEILGYEFRTLFDNALIGRLGRDLVAPDYVEKVEKFVGTKGRVKYLSQLLRHDGQRAWVEVSGETLPDYHGKPVRITYFSDVTIHMEKNQQLVDELRLNQSIKRLESLVTSITCDV